MELKILEKFLPIYTKENTISSIKIPNLFLERKNISFQKNIYQLNII
jgi:hypothetical protein